MLGTNGIQIAAALLFDFLQILGEEFHISKILEALQTQLSKEILHQSVASFFGSLRLGKIQHEMLVDSCRFQDPPFTDCSWRVSTLSVRP